MRKKILTGIMAGFMMLMCPVTVLGTENVEASLEEPLEDAAAEEGADESGNGSDAPEDGTKEAYTGAQDGDEDEEYITITQKDETNNVQVTFHLVAPEGFTLGAFLDIEHEQSGKVYHILCTAANNYYGRMFVPEGDYHVLNIGIADDIANQYPMIRPSDFSVEKNANRVIESTFAYYDEIDGEAKRRLSGDFSGEPEEPEEEEVKTPQYNGSYPWRKVGHVGEGSGRISYKGTSLTMSDYIIEITRSGNETTAEFRYSTDNGEHWSDIRVVGETDLYTTPNKRNTGLTLSFGKGSYTAGDTYTFYTDYEYVVTNDTMNNVFIRVYSTEQPKNTDYELRIKITETGKRGTGRFKYALDGIHFSEEVLIPEEGNFDIPGTVLKLVFVDDNGNFTVNDIFKASIEGIWDKRDYTMLYMGVGAVAAVICAVVFMYFYMMKEKPYEYTLNVYKKVELPVRRKDR